MLISVAVRLSGGLTSKELNSKSVKMGKVESVPGGLSAGGMSVSLAPVSRALFENVRPQTFL